MEVWGIIVREIIKTMDRQADIQARGLSRLTDIVERIIDSLRPGN
jgi:hypothetical protein